MATVGVTVLRLHRAKIERGRKPSLISFTAAMGSAAYGNTIVLAESASRICCLVQWHEPRRFRTISSAGELEEITIVVPKESTILIDLEYEIMVGTNLARGMTRVIQSLWPTADERPGISELSLDLLELVTTSKVFPMALNRLERVVISGLSIESVTNTRLIARDVNVGDLASLLQDTDSVVEEVCVCLEHEMVERIEIGSHGHFRVYGTAVTTRAAIEVVHSTMLQFPTVNSARVFDE